MESLHQCETYWVTNHQRKPLALVDHLGQFKFLKSWKINLSSIICKNMQINCQSKAQEDCEGKLLKRHCHFLKLSNYPNFSLRRKALVSSRIRQINTINTRTRQIIQHCSKYQCCDVFITIKKKEILTWKNFVWNLVKAQPILKSISCLASTDKDSFSLGSINCFIAALMSFSVIALNLALNITYT